VDSQGQEDLREFALQGKRNLFPELFHRIQTAAANVNSFSMRATFFYGFSLTLARFAPFRSM
jgi:hypothetical protein